MKNVIIILVAAVFGFSSVNTIAQITGGTTSNTTDKQREQTREGGTHEDMSEEDLEKIRKIVEMLSPSVVGQTGKLIEGMAWAAEKQREAGGVTMTGSAAGKVGVLGVRDVDEPVKSLDRFARRVFTALKEGDVEEVMELGFWTEENFMYIYYMDEHKEYRPKRDTLLPVSEKLKKKVLSLSPEGKKEILKEMSPWYIYFSAERKDELSEEIDYFYARGEKYKIDWFRAEYLYCFLAFPDDLNVVFSFEGKRYSFRVESILLPGGWMILDDIDNLELDVPNNDDPYYYSIERREKEFGDIFPERP